MGTLVIAGSADAVVIFTGDRTIMGRISKLSSHAKKVPTQLEHEILRFTYIIVSMAVTLSLFVFLYSLLYLQNAYPGFVNVAGALENAIGILVSFVPEGLPVALVLTLTLVAKRMGKLNVLVKNLSTIETLDSVDVLLSDKTGTLTTNVMSVTDIALDRSWESISESSLSHLYREKNGAVSQFLAVATLCNATEFINDKDHTFKKDDVELIC